MIKGVQISNQPNNIYGYAFNNWCDYLNFDTINIKDCLTEDLDKYDVFFFSPHCVTCLNELEIILKCREKYKNKKFIIHDVEGPIYLMISQINYSDYYKHIYLFYEIHEVCDIILCHTEYYKNILNFMFPNKDIYVIEFDLPNFDFSSFRNIKKDKIGIFRRGYFCNIMIANKLCNEYKIDFIDINKMMNNYKSKYMTWGIYTNQSYSYLLGLIAQCKILFNMDFLYGFNRCIYEAANVGTICISPMFNENQIKYFSHLNPKIERFDDIFNAYKCAKKLLDDNDYYSYVIEETKKICDNNTFKEDARKLMDKIIGRT